MTGGVRGGGAVCSVPILYGAVAAPAKTPTTQMPPVPQSLKEESVLRYKAAGAEEAGSVG